MKAVQPVEPSLPLPRPPGELDSALRDPATGLVAEEGIIGRGPLPSAALVGPELPKLGDDGVWKEDVPGPAPFRYLGPDADAGPRAAVGEEDVPDVEPDDLSQAETGAA